jgi:hypothetical protein
VNWVNINIELHRVKKQEKKSRGMRERTRIVGKISSRK